MQYLRLPSSYYYTRCGAARPICEAGTHRSKRMKNAASAVGILAIRGEEDVSTGFTSGLIRP